MSGDNSFLGGSLLGQRWYVSIFDARSVSHNKWRQFRSFQNKYGHWELVILYNTDKSSTFFHWKARAILRLWVLNKRRCYFWHPRGDWLQSLRKAAHNWLLLPSISSAPVQYYILIGQLRSFVTLGVCSVHSGFSPAYTDSTLSRRNPTWNRITGLRGANWLTSFSRVRLKKITTWKMAALF